MRKPKEIRASCITECSEHLVRDMAICLGQAIEQRGHTSLAVSGGRTPERIFPILAQQSLPWDRVSITLADERWVDPANVDSNEGLTRRLLLQGPASNARFIGLKTGRENPFDGQAETEKALARIDWPLDAIFLGMGEDGHIASLISGFGRLARHARQNAGRRRIR